MPDAQMVDDHVLDAIIKLNRGSHIFADSYRNLPLLDALEDVEFGRRLASNAACNPYHSPGNIKWLQSRVSHSNALIAILRYASYRPGVPIPAPDMPAQGKNGQDWDADIRFYNAWAQYIRDQTIA